LILPDVNVLVYAHREDAPDHERYRTWLEGVLNSEAPYGISDLVLSGFLRAVTHPLFGPSVRPFQRRLHRFSEPQKYAVGLQLPL